METRKQTKAKNAEMVRTETLTFRLNKRLRSLAEVAARHKGIKLANYVEGALEASLAEPIDFLLGHSIAAKADQLYDDDDAACFLKRTRFLWAMDPAQRRLCELVRTSKLLYPQWDVYDAVLIKQYWNELWAVAEGSDDLRALPSELFEGVDVEFALMSEADRIALYQKDPEGCAQRTQAYITQTKRIIDARTPSYPKARIVEQVDDYFGTKVDDPYRWMEDVDSTELKTWVDAENELTERYLARIPLRATMQKRLMELINFERYTAPARHGTRYFYSYNSGLQNQNVLYWQEGLDGEPKVLLDPNTFSADGTVAISGISITDDGLLAAYSVADAGSDWMTWHVREVTTGKDLPDVVEWSKFSGASWLKDGSGFFYARYDAPAADASDAEALKTANYFHKVYFHKLGTPQSDDALIFDRPDDGELNLGAQVTDDGRYLVLHQSKGTSPNNELSVKDLTRPDAPILKLIDTADATYAPINNDGSLLWLLTTLDAPNGRVISIDLNEPAREHWKTVIPESANKLSDISIIDNTFIANYLADAQSRVELRGLDGSLIEQLHLPAIGTAYGFGGLREDAETFYQFSNFTTPGTTYRLDMKTRRSTLFREPKLLFDPALYETRQIFVESKDSAASKDGARVPMFISHKKGLVLDGTAPTLLYGYGGFNISLMPEFSPSLVMWMEMGGVYAQASLRGGGEYGEAWHDAGTRVRKQNVFDDFVSLAEWLITNRYTGPKRLAISGGSNGGLLVAACELQRPDLFGAVVAQVGVMDMLRFDKFTIGWAWKEEYGSPSENEEEFRAIYKYSPLHNIRQGVSYPATLIMTGDHDDRVFPAHSFKYTAALQAAQTGTNPILIRVETRAGHGAGMPLSKRIEATVDQYAFMARELHIEGA